MRIKKFFGSRYFWAVLFFVTIAFFSGTFYYQFRFLHASVPVIEADTGPRKIRYLLANKAQTLDTLGKELYESLQFKRELNQQKHPVNILNLPEKPLFGTLQLPTQKQNLIKQDQALNRGWTVHFEEEKQSLDLEQPKKRKFYRVRVATVKSPDQANIVWSGIKAKNPIVFEKCKFLIDKKSLSNGSIIYCVALGEYKTREETYSILSSLRNVGQKAYTYQVLE